MIRKQFSVVAAALLFVCCAGAYAASYKVTDLSPNAEWAWAGAINDGGRIFGSQYNFLCSFENGDAKVLQDDANAVAVNNNGTVVGNRFHAESQNYEGYVRRNGVLTDIPALPGWQFSMATNINNSGVVCGYGQTNEDGLTTVSGFVWKDGVFTVLDPTSDDYIIPLGINDKGQVVGFSGAHSFLWEKGKMRFIDNIPHAQGGVGNNINNRGDIAGYVCLDSGEQHPCVWTNGVQRDLGLLSSAFAGSAELINERGVVAGNMYKWVVIKEPYLDYVPVAFVWEDGVMQVLPSLGGTTTCVTGINNRGQIVGWSSVPGDINTHHAVVWEPVSSTMRGSKQIPI